MAPRARHAGPPARQARGDDSGYGRPHPPASERVSDFLRRGGGATLRRRRAISGLSLFTIASFTVIGLYQSGILKDPPEPPLDVFDTKKVDASGEAFWPFAAPDAALGIAQYALTFLLAGMGDENRAKEQPWIPLALAGKVLIDAAGATSLTVEQVTKHKALCFYCTIAAAATYATVPLALPEAREAWRRLRS